MKYKITKQEYHKIIQQIEELKQELKKIRSQKQYVAESGGNLWHDNPSFDDLEAREKMLMRRIADWKNKLIISEIVDEKIKNDVVDIGSTVELEFDDGHKQNIRIVGHMSGNPNEGKIAYDAPLGNALMGAKLGEKRAFKIGEQNISVKIEKIS